MKNPPIFSGPTASVLFGAFGGFIAGIITPFGWKVDISPTDLRSTEESVLVVESGRQWLTNMDHMDGLEMGFGITIISVGGR